MIKAYFASDFHLGAPGNVSSQVREKQIVRWLDQIEQDATHLFLVGDLFDFWYEYKSVVPKGHVRLLGKLASLTDAGLPIHIFSGNHDLWLRDYLVEEIGCSLHHEPIEITLGSKNFKIGHGDGLGPGDHGYKRLKKVFSSKSCQWLFSRLHPNLAFSLAHYWSTKSRQKAPHKDRFEGKDGEWLVHHCESVLKEKSLDYFIFGHRHLPIDCTLSDGHSKYYNLGDWLIHNSFAYFDGDQMHLDFFESEHPNIIEL